MGNAKTKTNKLTYKTRYFSSPITLDLSEFSLYSKQPNDKLVDAQLNEILSEIISNEKAMIKTFPYSLKWKLICKHREYISKNLKSIADIDKTESQVMIQKIIDNPSVTDLQNILDWMGHASFADLQEFFDYGGIKCLLDVLKVAELCSRKTGDFNKNIAVLRILLYVTKTENGTQYVCKISDAIVSLFLNFNYLQVEVTSLVMEIISQLLWDTENDESTLGNIFESLVKFKNENGLKTRFDVFIRLLSESRNVILIDNVIDFIITIVSAPIDSNKRFALKEEFLQSGLQIAFALLKEKIDKKLFKLEDSTFEGVKARIERDKKIERTIHQKSAAISEMAIPQETLDYYEAFSPNRRKGKDVKEDLTKFQEQSLKLTMDSSSILNRQSQVPSNRQSNVSSKCFSRAGTISEKQYYLSKNDNIEFFEMYLQAILTRMDAFEKLDLEDIRASIEVTNPDEIFKEIREKSMVLDSYAYFLGILQKLKNIPEGSGSKIFVLVDEFLNAIVDKNDAEDGLDGVSQETIREIFKNERKLKEIESKLEQMQLSMLHQEKIISNLKSQLNILVEGTNSSPISPPAPPSPPPPPPPPLLPSPPPPPPPPPLSIPSPPPLPPPSPPPSLFTPPPPPPPPSPPFGIGIPPPPPFGIGIPPPPPFGVSPPPFGVPPPPPFGIPPPPSNTGVPPPPPPPFGLSGSGIPPPPPSGFGIPPPPGLGIPPPPPGFGIPPPPPGFGIPLPPGVPPPPGIGLPPPPPGLFGPIAAPIVPVKNKKNPKVPMKALMWVSVAGAKIGGTVWEKVDDEKVRLDVELIEKEFVNLKAKEAKEKEKEGGNKSVEETKIPKKEEKQKISLLPPEKFKNIEIILGKLKMEAETIYNALLQCDSNILSLNTLESLISLMPNEAELKMLKEYDGEKELLTNPDKFILTLLNLNGIVERMQALKFIKIYEELVEDLNNKLNSLLKVWGGIEKDEILRELLEYILAVGNYLNGTSARGGAFGFKLDSLEKLLDIKNTEGKKNLLLFVIETIEKNKSKVIIDENMDLSDYEMASRLPISQLNSDLGELKKGSKYLAEALKNKNNEDDKIEKTLKGSFVIIEKIIINLEEKIKKCEKFYETAASFFCENPKDSSEKFGEKIYKFWQACRNSKKTILKEIELAKKMEEKAKLKDEEILNKAKSLKNKPSLLTVNSDAILEKIKLRQQSKIMKRNEDDQ